MFQNFLTNSGPNPLKKLVMEIDGFFIITSSGQTVLLWNNKQLKRSLLITEIQRPLKWIIKGTDEGLNKRLKLITLISYIFQKEFQSRWIFIWAFEHIPEYVWVWSFLLYLRGDTSPQVLSAWGWVPCEIDDCGALFYFIFSRICH